MNTFATPRRPLCLLAAILIALAGGSVIAADLLVSPPTATAPATAPAGRIRYRQDFDGGGKLSALFSASGPIAIYRRDVPGADNVDGVKGKGLCLQATGPAHLVARPIPRLGDITDCDRVEMCIRGEGAAIRPVTIEFRWYTSDPNGRFWRKITINSDKWQKLSLPLRFFRESGRRVPRWSDVTRYGIYLRGQGKVWVDDIRLVRGKHARAALLGMDELATIAFGPNARVRVIARKGLPFRVLATSDKVPEKSLLAELEKMHNNVRRDFPAWPEPTDPVPLVIFATRKDYQDFWTRLAAKYNSEIVPPKSGGFCALGVATTFLPDDPTKLRPVFVHETAHALIRRMGQLGNIGEWAQEGLATRYQLAYSNQDIAPIVRAALKNPRYLWPLKVLLSGRRLPTGRYWQAATFLDWALADPARAKALRGALAEALAQGSTDLRPVAKKHFGNNLDALETEWLVWLNCAYPDKSDD